MTEYKVPNTFVAGTRAKASQVNKNFTYVTDSLTQLDNAKADRTGDQATNFSVAEPIESYHAVTKRYVDLAVGTGGGGGGSGVGKSMFEIFSTLSTRTPSGAFSLRTGEIIPDAKVNYGSFWEALNEQGSGVIPDFTDSTWAPYGEGNTGVQQYITSVVAEDDETPESVVHQYKLTLTNSPLAEDAKDSVGKAISPFSWLSVNKAPSNEEPMVLQLELPEVMTCPFFRINSHVSNTYDSSGFPDPAAAPKVAVISIRQPDGTWLTASIISEMSVPTRNDRYYTNQHPKIEFDAVRIVVSENFGSERTDLSLYPVDPEKTSVRVVSEEQWQWEIDNFNETGAFVRNEEGGSVRLPKITRFISGVSDLWEVGIPSLNTVSKSSMRWQDGSGSSDSEDPDPSSSQLSLNTVSTGLWIQVYNAVAELSIANMKYIPHSTLFEERTFRFVPDETTGWYPVSRNYWDGSYFVDAMTELLNWYATAEDVEGKNYKLAANNMIFVTDEVYESTYTTYGEVPYYVIDRENNRFKTPVSENYVRCTSDTTKMNQLFRDSIPNITGRVGAVGEENTNYANGAFYQGELATGHGGGKDYLVYMDASRCHTDSVYGRSTLNEVLVRSNTQILCVFLGNEIPQSSAVDVFYKMKATDARIEALEQTSTGETGKLQEDIKSLQDTQTVQDENIRLNTQGLESVNIRVDEKDVQIESIQADLVEANDKISSLSLDLTVASTRIDSASDFASQALSVATSKQDTIVFKEGLTYNPETKELAAIEYDLPVATSSTLGGVKVGANLSIDENGVLSAQASPELEIASSTVLGGIKVGSNLTIDANGKLSAKIPVLDVTTDENLKVEQDALNTHVLTLTMSEKFITTLTSMQATIDDLVARISALEANQLPTVTPDDNTIPNDSVNDQTGDFEE